MLQNLMHAAPNNKVLLACQFYAKFLKQDSPDAIINPLNDGDDDRNTTKTTMLPPAILAGKAASLPYQLELAAITAEITQMQQCDDKNFAQTNCQMPPTMDTQLALAALSAKIAKIVNNRPTVQPQPATTKFAILPCPKNSSIPVQQIALVLPLTTLTTICPVTGFTLTDHFSNTQITLWPPHQTASHNKLASKSVHTKRIYLPNLPSMAAVRFATW